MRTIPIRDVGSRLDLSAQPRDFSALPTVDMKRRIVASLVILLALVASSLAPSALADEVRSDLALGVYRSNVTDEALTDSPQWSDHSREPPLPMIAALRAATAKLKTLPASDQPVKWVLRRVRLQRAKTDTGWYYVVTFRSKYVPDPPDGRGRLEHAPNPYVTPRDLHIPVLMDGSVPEISIKRHSDAMLKLLDDLKM